MTTRREFLATLGAVVAVGACRNSAPGQTAVASAGNRRFERIGIQLYSVRDEMRKDVAGTLARLSQLGYREVEFAGYFNKSPAEIRQLLAANNLTSPSTHVGYDVMKGNWDKMLDDAAAIGHRWITVPWLPENLRGSVASWRTVAKEFNAAGEKARARGLRFAYHNHEFEFMPRVEGQVPFDVLLAETDPALVDFELDVFWTVRGGADPLAYFREHPARFPLLHIKDSAGAPDHRQVDVGQGTIDFAALLRLDASQQKAIKHLFIEHDQPADPFAFAKNSFDYLSRLEY